LISFRVISRHFVPAGIANSGPNGVEWGWFEHQREPSFLAESNSNPQKIRETHVQSASEAMIFFPHAWQHHLTSAAFSFPISLSKREVSQ
jgi:hypothetical protein